MNIFFSLLVKVLKSKWELLKPKKAKILLFDNYSAFYLCKIFKKEEIEILNTRFEKINFYILFICLLKGKINPKQYYKEYIEKVSPKVIITFIDNDPKFWELYKLTNVKTALIQMANKSHYWADNNFRNLYSSKRKKKIFKVNYMFFFNKHTAKKYETFIKGKSFVIGSFKNNMFQVSKKKKKKEICYISTFKSASNHKFYKKNHKNFMIWLKQYSKKNNLKINILGRSIEDETIKEKEYYEKIFSGNKYNFIEAYYDRPTYKIIDQFKYVFTVDSTLGTENFSRNGRTGFIGNTPDEYPIKTIKFGWNEKIKSKGKFWTNENNDKEFERVFNFVINGKEAEWSKLRKKYKNLMPFDYKNQIFKKKVMGIIKKV